MTTWQDDIRGALDGLAYGARSALSPRVLHGAAVEIGWLTTHLAMYPLGLVGGSGPRHQRLTLAGLTPAQRSLLVSDVRAAGTPILLAHGIIDNHTIFALMRRQLLRRGFSSIHTFSYSPLTLDVRRTAERMGAGDRGDLRGVRVGPDPCRRAQPGRTDRAVLHPAARR